MIAIIDYGVGNIFSLYSSFKKIGAEVSLTSSVDEIRKSDKIILPGVGAFADAADKLEKSGLAQIVKAEAECGKPLLGICLGMQLLFEKSYEYGEHKGLGLIKGSVRAMEGKIPAEYKIPHIGWNRLHFTAEKNPIFKNVSENDCVYFVHSYYGTDCEKSVIATTDYGIEMTAAVANKNVYGMQFHPEKSGSVGLEILKSFCEF